MFNITKSQVLEAFNYRAACRYYDPTRKISKEDMDYILELARLSPSSVGSEPWQFLVLQNPAIRQKIAPVAWCCKQTYIALGNMMTGAALIGIDSCPIEGFNYDEVNRILSEEGLFDANEYGVSRMVT
ncbi:MAG: NAD(P)H-dependent oxidoreductase, partial [Actinobacillus minor]|nr:NAD(P)H-dependent oxidoreductase [Actinobacillus minor]